MARYNANHNVRENAAYVSPVIFSSIAKSSNVFSNEPVTVAIKSK